MIIRKHYLDKLIKYLDTEFIKVITGVRRSGKSFLLLMLKEKLLKEDKQVLYLNFENPETFNIQHYDKLYQYIKDKINSSKKVYFLFDEIGEVSEWQRLINGLRASFNCDIYLTGSNANLLSGELATYISGRYVEIKIYPLSFKEYLSFNEEDKIDLLLDNYIRYGGFPSVSLVHDEQMKRDVLKGIYNSVILKDVSLRGNINNIDILMKLSLFLLDNIGNTISGTKIANYFVSTGLKVKSETINRYLVLLENSFIFYKVNRYDIRGKERLKTLGKYYVVDLGLKNVVLGRINTNLGSMIENLVYLKLLQEEYDVFVGKYNDVEIDFVCFKEEVVKYVQVTLSIPKNSKRETNNLLNINDNYERIIVTNNYSDVGIIDGIKVIHLTDFLLNKI